MKIVKKIVKTLIDTRYWWVALLSLLIAVGGNFMLSSGSNDLSPTSPTSPTSLTSQTGWHPVPIGGGGYVTGIYPHPTEADLVYVRTDNGGFFRWQPTEQQWLPITNNLPVAAWHYDPYSGGEALGLDPQNPDLIYVAVGKYTVEPGTIFKSSDRGKTWQPSNLSIPMGGDEDKRWAGDRLVVNPFDSNVLLFGSRLDGLWRSQDGGINWTQITTLPIETKRGIGVNAIAFNSQKKNLVYASIYGDGVYQSLDSGLNWQKLAGSPRKVMKLAVAGDSILYTTNHEAPQVTQYAGGKWLDISPSGFVSETFNGLSLHPQNPAELLVTEGEKGESKIYYSSDRGKTWQRKHHTLNKTVDWLADEFFADHPSAIAFDPHNPQRVWLTDWFSVWHTDNIEGKNVTWTNRVRGIEQTVLLALAAPPAGATLLSGVADQGGFYHRDLDRLPNSRLGFANGGKGLKKLMGKDYLDNYFQDTSHIAYCQTQPQHLVRIGSQRWRDNYLGVTSDDGGLSWQPWENIPDDTMFLRVAVSATLPQHFVVTTSEKQPLVTHDGGKSWSEVWGLPDGEKAPWNWNQPLVADGQKGDRFYYYSSGTVYRSDDGGLSFQIAKENLPKAENYILTTTPEVAGEIWLSLDREGLYKSSDGGVSFQQIKSITRSHLVTVGKPMTEKLPHTIYTYGTLTNGKSGLLISTDSGANWQQITANSNMPRGTRILTASQQQSGLIFAGTDGRGIYYQLIKASQSSFIQANSFKESV